MWWKVSNAPCLLGLPPNLTDFFLVKQSFLVTDSAAKTRCHFPKEDLRNTAMVDATAILSQIAFTAQWRSGDVGPSEQQEESIATTAEARTASP